MRDSFKYRFRSLVLTKKLILFGAAFAFIGVFLPWYQDIDKFNTGDMFLGVTGPLYLAGLIVLLAAAASLGIIMMKLLDKRIPKLPLEENHLYVFNSSISLLMLVVALSVYFHNKFGINIINKTMGVGMIFSFIGSGLMMVGSIMSLKKDDVDFEESGHIEPLIEIENEDRAQSPISPKPIAENVVDEFEGVRDAVQESIEDFAAPTAPTQDTKDINTHEER